MSLLMIQLIVGLILAALLASMGSFAVLRRLSWFSDGMAHVSLGGIAVAAATSAAPLPAALAWTVGAAIAIFWLERRTKLPTDAMIGILFTASMAFGILLFQSIGADAEQIEEALFGGLATVTMYDLVTIAILAGVILTWVYQSRRELTLMGLSEEIAHVHGVKTQRQTLILYIALAMTTVLGAKVLGVVLVSGLLIIPPSISRLITRTFSQYTLVSLVTAELIMVAGIWYATVHQLSPGPVTVLIGAGLFLVITIVQAARIVRIK